MKTNKAIAFSDHSLEQIKRRGLTKQSVVDVINSPSSIIKDKGDIEIYQKIAKKNNKHYLYRVFVNTNKKPPLIVTAYKTSKINKYENQV